MSIDKFKKDRIKALIKRAEKMTLGEILREAREIYGYTRKMVAASVNRTEGSLFQVEAKNQAPGVDFLNAASDFYGLPRKILITAALRLISDKYATRPVKGSEINERRSRDIRYGINTESPTKGKSRVKKND